MPSVSEFHARYSLSLKPDPVQMEAIDYLTGKINQPPKSWQELGEVSDPTTRLALLTQAIMTAYKDYSRVGRRRDAGLLGSLGRLELHYKDLCKNFLYPLCLDPVIPDISMFPQGSWAMSFRFKLRKPYISRDDTDFYIIDNPIRKEWIFKLPYIAGSQWKGALRAAMVKQLADTAGSLSKEEFANRRFCLSLLFGDVKGGEQGDIKDLAKYLDNANTDAANLYRKKIREYFKIKDDEALPSHTGFLIFYPTYFTQIGLEVINPHDRETGTGAQPIYFESVPSGAEGTFVLLYVPYNLTGKGQDKIKEAMAADICLVTEGIRAMMLQYGFGAKTSSGHGTAKPELKDGKVILKAMSMDMDKKEESKPQQPEEAFLKYLYEDGSVKEEFQGSGEAGLLSNSEYGERMQKLGAGSQTEFKNFRRWYKEHGEEWQKFVQNQKVPASKFPERTFTNFDEMVEETLQIAQLLKISGKMQ